jgi:hypothetical protein
MHSGIHTGIIRLYINSSFIVLEAAVITFLICENKLTM